MQLAERHSSTPPLSLIAIPSRNTNPEHEVKPIPRRYLGRTQTVRDPVVQSTSVTLLAPTLALSFAGVGQGFSGPSGTFTVSGAPPDTNGDVGPNHYVQTVNQDFMIWDKSGAKLHGPLPINSLFQSLGGLCAADNDGDPVVLYDRAANRWFISQFPVTNPNPNYHQCIAVSQTADPTGGYSAFNDYGKAGVWSDAYYFTYNMFTGGTTFAGAKVCAFNRSAMLTGAAASQQCFDTSTSYGGLLPADIDGARTPAAGEPEFVLGLGTGTTDLAFWKFHVDWTTPANSSFAGPTVLTVPAYAEACNGGTCIPQSGTSQQLDSLADRMMFRLQWRQTADGVEHLVTNHSVTAGSSTGVRWYEIRNPNGTPTVFQSGTYAPDSAYRWMGSAAMDGSGGIALGFSKSSSSAHPAIGVTGRNASDAAGTMGQGETIVLTGGGSQTGSNLSRWGDYSNIAVDPTDDCTFWYTTEYIPSNGAFNWDTQVATFKLSGCGGTVTNDFSISANPTTVSVVQGGSGTTTISTATTSGSAQSVSLSASGVPAGTTATFNPASVTSGGSSTLTFAVGASTAVGTYTVTVTGTGASATHNTPVTLTVTAPVANDFSISASPSSLSVAQGGSGTSTISTATTSGSAQTVSLSASGLPSGATASFNPASVTSGGSSTLTITVGSSTATGTYSVTVTGTGTSATHSTAISLTVTAATSGGGIVNGGFETGNLTGWSSTGTTSVGGSAHTGSFAAVVGSTSPTVGDSSIAQTFSAPSTGGTLIFWYNVHCPDSLTYDWATATLRDNTSATTTTVLAKVCSNTGAWQQISAQLTASHSYTLTLISHDDNYPGDATYTQYDDVAIAASTPPPPNAIVNGGFETGSLSGWTPSGAATSVTTTSHSGTYAAMLGSTSPTNGDSSISQTFTAPSGSTRLTFWYANNCPDTVTYDWATATLKDNTLGTTTTILPKICTAVATWTQVSASLTAGHSYTLTLTNRDDNYPGDPTYTLYDDVATQ